MKKVIIRRVSTPANGLEFFHPLLARIYQARGVQSTTELELSLKELIPFHHLMDIDKAVVTLASALQKQQHIMIIGDFDADGATSTALAVSALKYFGAKNISYLVPNRFEYGYGLTPEIVNVAARSKPDLIITVDNGISSVAGVALANQLGINVIITDHHLPGNELPAAAAIVNPNQKGDEFASKNLAGVGVIFYLMLALRAHLRSSNWFTQQNIPDPNMVQLLDLVALGTVADVVTLDKNNRILVKQGLERIRNNKMCLGIRALLEVGGRSAHNLLATDLGFVVGPRLNAAGRLDDISLGIECLLTDDANKARAIAVQLDTLNRERQAIEETMQQQAQQILRQLHFKDKISPGICLFDENWHQGVIGILAARIKEQFHRPVIAFARISDTELKGSARSIAGVHIRDVLAEIAVRHPELISKFGGHAMAAGLSLEQQNYAAFAQIFAEEVNRHVNSDELYGKIYSDGELTATELSLEIAEMLAAAGPWGQGFSQPIFDGIFSLVEQRIVGQNHLKMILSLNNNEKIIDAIAFNVDLKNWPNHRCEKVQIAYRLDINEFRGRRNIQLLVEHLEPII